MLSPELKGETILPDRPSSSSLVRETRTLYEDAKAEASKVTMTEVGDGMAIRFFGVLSSIR